MKRYVPTILLTICGALPGIAGEPPFSFGTINPSQCTETKAYQEIQKSGVEFIEAMRKELGLKIQEKDEKIQELTAKINDLDYMDTLSVEAQEKLRADKTKEEKDRNTYTQQYLHSEQIGKQQIAQMTYQYLFAASEKVAKEKGLKSLINQDAFFYVSPEYDLTADVMRVMDEEYELQVKADQAGTQRTAASNE